MLIPQAKINITCKRSLLLRRYLYTLNVELQLNSETISPFIDRISRALMRYITLNSKLSANTLQTSAKTTLINVKGRDPSEPPLLAGASRPHSHELFYVGGEIATDTDDSGEFIWEPFSVSLNTDFLAFEGARSILHSLHTKLSQSIPEFLPWWLLGWAAPVRPQYMRLGIELFTSRFALTKLGFIPEVTEALYLELLDNKLALRFDSEQLPLRRHNPFQRDPFLGEISDILQELYGVSPKQAFAGQILTKVD
jgi:hypothetical protein